MVNERLRKSGGIFLIFFLLVASPLLISIQFVSAQQSSSTISQGFNTDNSEGEIVAGALVSIKGGNPESVALATTNSVDYLAGIADKNSLVTISKGSQETQVVLSGTATALVSDINGTIKRGDKITISPIAGVGMKAVTSSQVVGTAQSNFIEAATRIVTDQRGEKHTVHLGHVEIQVDITYYQTAGSNFLPPFIQNVANSIAGRPVSLIRIILCSLLLLLSFTSVIILVYTSVRSAMTSIGRNPLAARAIRKGLLQVGVISLIVVAGTLLASYAILRI